jgi:hypothetical protein
MDCRVKLGNDEITCSSPECKRGFLNAPPETNGYRFDAGKHRLHSGIPRDLFEGQSQQGCRMAGHQAGLSGWCFTVAVHQLGHPRRPAGPGYR